MKKNKLSIIVILHTMAIAMFADIRSVNWALVYGGFVREGAMNIIYPVVIGLIVITSILIQKKGALSRNQYPLLVVGYLLIMYLITIFFLGKPRVTLPMFMALSVFAFFIPSIGVVNAKLLIKGMMFFPFFAIFRLDSVFQMVTEWQNYMNMDASYAFLVPVVANIVYLFCYYKEESRKEKIVTLLLSLCNMIFCGRILAHGSRGVVLSIFLVLAFLFVTKINQISRGIVINKGKLKAVLIASVVVAAFYVVFFDFIYRWLENVFGITFYAFEKTARMGAEGTFDNGRNNIVIVTLNRILEQPIFGYGTDRFEEVTGLNYPHNFILQMLFDGGLVLFFILFVPFCISIARLLKRCTKDEFAVFCVFFFASVPGALFSQDLWNMPVIWMTMGYCMSKGFVKSEYCYVAPN